MSDKEQEARLMAAVTALAKVHDAHRWDSDDVCVYCGLEIHRAADLYALARLAGKEAKP